MKILNPNWVRAIKKTTNSCPYFELQGMKIVEMEWGKSKLEIEIQQKHMQPFGVAHGGVFASLIDATGFWSVFSRLDSSVGMTTIDLKLNYIAPVMEGIVFGLGRCIKLGKSIGIGEGRVEDENGRLLAHGTTTVIVQPDLLMYQQAEMPEKFL